VDVDPDTLNISPAAIQRSIGPRTRAIVVVHFAGHPADLPAIDAIAARHGLLVIEDAAHALPAKSCGRSIGARENLTAFSFYATKNLTTAEGGMLTGPAELLARARPYTLHGISRDAWDRYGKAGDWRYEVIVPGYKYNMTDIQASLGLVQLRRLADFHRRRQAIVARYNDAFRNLSACELPVARKDVDHAWHLYVLRLARDSHISRDGLIQSLKERRITASVHFIPLHTQPFYRDKYGYAAEDLPVAWDNGGRILSLPLSPALTDEQIERVIDGVREVLRSARRRAA
jgi:dTDP-4-amino-4,6-dideoxygalactose transaminase